MPDKLHRHFQWIGIGIYLAALLIVSVCWRNFALKPLWMIWGIGTVLFFFLLTYWFSRRWSHDDTKTFRRKVFWWALGIRMVYVGAIIFYYYLQTGLSMEYEVADSWTYHQMACYLANLARKGQFTGILRSRLHPLLDYALYLLWKKHPRTSLAKSFDERLYVCRYLQTHLTQLG